MPDVSPPMAIEVRAERSESARLDAFVDGAFAFAITLLVISGASLPKNFAALEYALRGVPAFAACFAQLAFFWHGHVRWRDSVRLTDRTGLVLSLVLVFFALIFVFPLHLVFASFFSSVTGGWLSPDFALGGVTIGALAALFVCFGLSFACMAGTLALLFRHGARHARLPAPERTAARVATATWGYCALVGLASTVIALVALAGAAWLIAVAGFLYALLGCTGIIAGWTRKRLAREDTP